MLPSQPNQEKDITTNEIDEHVQQDIPEIPKTHMSDQPEARPPPLVYIEPLLRIKRLSDQGIKKGVK